MVQVEFTIFPLIDTDMALKSESVLRSDLRKAMEEVMILWWSLRDSKGCHDLWCLYEATEDVATSCDFVIEEATYRAFLFFLSFYFFSLFLSLFLSIKFFPFLSTIFFSILYVKFFFLPSSIHKGRKKSLKLFKDNYFFLSIRSQG